MRRHFAAFALRASARAGALDAIVNVTVDTIHTIATSALVVIYAVLTVSAMGVAWTLRPQNTHDRAQTGAGAFGAAKNPTKMRSRDLSTRATALCTVHTAHKMHKTHKTRTAASIALTGGLLAVLVLAAQVGPARAYGCTSDGDCSDAFNCTSDADCAYATCNDVSCSGYESSSRCNNGVWDAKCVSTTYVTTTKQAETLCTVFPLFRIVLLWRVLESED